MFEQYERELELDMYRLARLWVDEQLQLADASAGPVAFHNHSVTTSNGMTPFQISHGFDPLLSTGMQAGCCCCHGYSGVECVWRGAGPSPSNIVGPSSKHGRPTGQPDPLAMPGRTWVLKFP